MSIEFRCGHCQSVLRTPDDSAGKAARCPNCGKIAPIPASDSATFSPDTDSPTELPLAKEVPNPYSSPPPNFSPYAPPYSAGAFGYPEPSLDSARNKLLPPTITLMVLNGVGLMFVLLGMVGGVLSIVEEGINDEDVGLLIGCGIWVLFSVTSLVGCISILRMRGFGLSLAGLICSIIAGIPCCFLPTAFGIWALVVVLDPNVKRFFR